MRKGSRAFQSLRRRRNRMAQGQTRRKLNLRVNAPEFVPSWLQKSVRSSTRVVTNGINSLLREINTKRRKSLNETRKTR